MSLSSFENGLLARLVTMSKKMSVNGAFARRFSERNPKRNYPTYHQAGVYSAVYNYLKSVAAIGSADDGAAVVARMKRMPTDDPVFGRGMIREDGEALYRESNWVDHARASPWVSANVLPKLRGGMAVVEKSTRLI